MRVLRDSGQTQHARQEGHEGKTHNKRFHDFVLFIRLVTFTKEQAKRFSTETAKQARKFQHIQDRWAVALEFHQALITKLPAWMMGADPKHRVLEFHQALITKPLKRPLNLKYAPNYTQSQETNARTVKYGEGVGC